MAKASKQKISLVDLVDELGRLEAELAPLKPKISRIDTLRKLLRSSFPDMGASDSRTFNGLKFSAFLGPREIERSVNVVKLSHFITQRAFVGLASVTLGALEAAAFAPEVCAMVIDSEMTGSRPLRVTPLAAGKAA